MRQMSGLLLVFLVSGLGCTPLPFVRNDPPPQAVIKPPPAPPIVLPDTINEKNASERAHSLRDEMEFDAGRKAAGGATEKN